MSGASSKYLVNDFIIFIGGGWYFSLLLVLTVGDIYASIAQRPFTRCLYNFTWLSYTVIILHRDYLTPWFLSPWFLSPWFLSLHSRQFFNDSGIFKNRRLTKENYWKKNVAQPKIPKQSCSALALWVSYTHCMIRQGWTQKGSSKMEGSPEKMQNNWCQ